MASTSRAVPPFRAQKALAALLAALALLAAATAPPAAAATTVDRIVAQVNSEVITLSDLNARLKTISPALKSTLPPGTNLEMEVLNQLIEMELISQMARRIGIVVGEQEVDQAIESIKSENNINDAQFRASLAREGQTVENFRANIKFQILRDMVVRENLLRRIVITDREVDDYLAGGGANFAALGEGATPLDKIRIIFIEPGAMAKATSVYNQVLSGSMSFAEAARQYSQGMGADDGGDLGMTVGDLDERLGSLIRTLAPGQVGPPIDRGQDILLIYVEPRANAQAAAAPAAKRAPSDYTPQQREAARRQLEQLKARDKFDAWLADIKSKANIKITL
jgi:peptidyl-prolyl cis-trans isomerase SurA